MLASINALGISISSIVCNEKMPIISDPNIKDRPKLNFNLIRMTIIANAMITPIRFNTVP